MTNCKHTNQQGKQGETGYWCVDCGIKVMAIEARPCKDCGSLFVNDFGHTECEVHETAVIPNMYVCYKIADGSCFTPRREEVLSNQVDTINAVPKAVMQSFHKRS